MIENWINNILNGFDIYYIIIHVHILILVSSECSECELFVFNIDHNCDVFYVMIVNR